MASSPSNPPKYASLDTSTPPNTTFVQADLSNFRTIVQKLTGASDDQSFQKLPVTHHHHYHRANTTSTTAPKRPAFKLHERRKQNDKNLQLNNLNLKNPNTTTTTTLYNLNGSSSSFLVSPVSTLDFFSTRVISSPISPYEDENNNYYSSHEGAEERAIAEKGFYLYPITPWRKTPGEDNPPELLPLFPLTSPGDVVHENKNCTTSHRHDEHFQGYGSF